MSIKTDQLLDRTSRWDQRRHRLMELDYRTSMKMYQSVKNSLRELDEVNQMDAADPSGDAPDDTETSSSPVDFSLVSATSQNLVAMRKQVDVLKNIAALAREASALGWGAVNVGLADHLAAMTKQTSKIDPLFNSELDPPFGSSIFGK